VRYGGGFDSEFLDEAGGGHAAVRRRSVKRNVYTTTRHSKLGDGSVYRRRTVQRIQNTYVVCFFSLHIKNFRYTTAARSTLVMVLNELIKQQGIVGKECTKLRGLRALVGVWV